MVDRQTKSAPADAFAFASECQFAEAKPRDKSGLRKMPVDVLARTGKPVYHWYWGMIVHDMDGMRSKSKIAFDYRHDPDEPIGYADTITAKNDLRLGGELLSRREDDQAARIMDLGPAGVPYEASVHFDPRTVVLEFLPEQAQTTVNGETITGPITIMREWDLLRCAICLTGVDTGTETNFSGEDTAQFDLNWKDPAPMTKTNDTGKQSGTESGDGKQAAETTTTTTPTGSATPTTPESSTGQQSGTTQTSVSPETNHSQFEAKFRSELKRYTDRFGGEDGAKYFSEGLNYEQSLEKHVVKLEQVVKQALTDKAAAEEKLAKLDLGETEGVNTGTPNTAQSKSTKFEDMHKPAVGAVS